MKYMFTYDLMETMRTTNQWMGATARAIGTYPMANMGANPAVDWIRAWGEVTERTFSRMAARPDWGIPSVTVEDGTDHTVHIETLVSKPFGDLIHFKVPGRKKRSRRVLLVAPMSGHYATLLRKTVISLLPDCEVYITDWHSARDIAVSEGKFDVEDYTLYLVEFMKKLGSDLHVIAVCQPAPLTLAATAYLAEEDPSAQPRSLTLIGGPIDPEANHTEVTDFGRSVTMGQLEQTMIQRVGLKHAGAGRMVYPGLLQLASFVSMNSETHSQAFKDQINRVAHDDAADHDKHNIFYDEYLAVMDMTAEFYLSTVERIFKEREIARNVFVVDGRKVDIGKITTVAVKIVEGEDDDISAPGQCLAALDLLTGLPDSKKAAHLEPGAGHYGIFAGKSWRNNIRPLVLKFIDQNSAPQKDEKSVSKGTSTKTGSAKARKLSAKAAKPAVTEATALKSTPQKAMATKAAPTSDKAAPALKVVETKTAPKAPVEKTAAPKTPAQKTPANKTPANKTVANKTVANKTVALKTAPAKTVTAKPEAAPAAKVSAATANAPKAMAKQKAVAKPATAQKDS